MNNNLPYVNLHDELHLNACILMILIYELEKTNRSKYVLNFDRLQILFYLVNKPSYLRRLLQIAMKPDVDLREEEYFSVNAISFSVDDLFDRDRLRSLLQYISSKGYVESVYDKSNGFCFKLNEIGVEQVEKMTEKYFQDVRKYSESMKNILSLSISKLNGLLNRLFVEGK